MASRRFDFLLEDQDEEETIPERLRMYESSVNWLSVIYDNPNIDYVSKFAAKVGRRFVEILIQNDPRSLTIVGYFFMLPKTIHQASWLPTSNLKEFQTLMKLLPEEWKPGLQWAVGVFEGQG